MRNQTHRAAPLDDDRALIHELFAARQQSYDERDVLRLTRTSKARLSGIIDDEKLGRGDPFKWEDVVTLALERWTPRMLHNVLGDLLPPLNQTAVIPVELPIYQIRVLHGLAVSWTERQNPPLNASDIIERAVHLHLVPDYFETVGAATPETLAAAEFPHFRPALRLVRRCCRYCGGGTAVNAQACTACLVRHETGAPGAGGKPML